jgi:hypothetical protein
MASGESAVATQPLEEDSFGSSSSVQIESSSSVPWGRLHTLNPLRGSVYLTKPCVTLGRSTQNDIAFVTEIHISSIHCKIERSSEGTYVTDSSSNGTYINGTRIPKGVATSIHSRDELSLAIPSSSSVAGKSQYRSKILISQISIFIQLFRTALDWIPMFRSNQPTN